jgi:hypothetical protein
MYRFCWGIYKKAENTIQYHPECYFYCSYANNESYLKAIENFEGALLLNPGHTNAKKYMCETLVAQGRR